jgi:hypothetical protein
MLRGRSDRCIDECLARKAVDSRSFQLCGAAPKNACGSQPKDPELRLFAR